MIPLQLCEIWVYKCRALLSTDVLSLACCIINSVAHADVLKCIDNERSAMRARFVLHAFEIASFTSVFSSVFQKSCTVLIVSPFDLSPTNKRLNDRFACSSHSLAIDCIE